MTFKSIKELEQQKSGWLRRFFDVIVLIILSPIIIIGIMFELIFGESKSYNQNENDKLNKKLV